MLDLISSWLISIWPYSQDLQRLRLSSLPGWIETTDPQTLTRPQFVPDAGAIAAVEAHLKALEDQGLPAERQSVWVQSGRTVLAEHLGNEPLPAASLTKIATTLAALDTWGVDHQFSTLVSYTGTLENGVIQGDLIVQGGGDPFFVWEEAIALANALNQAGVEAVAGNLVIVGPFAMNFKDNPLTAGRLLQQGLSAPLWPAEAETQFATLPPETPRPQLPIQGTVQTVDSAALEALGTTPLIQHQSLPLVEILKQMNIYSNNFIADSLAESLGGGEAVAEKVAAIAQIPSEEIQLVNGSGLGADNRLSAHAVCALLMATHALLLDSNWTISDVLPVAGIDTGTIKGRALPRATAVKTGTLSVVSTLAGAMPTVEQDVVWFAILNWGSDLDGLRDQQDRLLWDWVSLWSSAKDDTGGIARRPLMSEDSAPLGAPDRNDILLEF
ncbi:MAG: D-alanyl-D-alanine carboxypeptidase [Elainellaceae cyanobacterium]